VQQEKEMKFYIREWSDNTIVLMTETGHVLSYFSTINDALHACSEWYDVNLSEKKYEVTVQYRKSVQAYESMPAYA
jgi:hypothetical protein